MPLYPVLPACPILPCSALFCVAAQFCPVLPCSVLFCLAVLFGLFCPIQPGCPVLPCSAWLQSSVYPVLFCPVWLPNSRLVCLVMPGISEVIAESSPGGGKAHMHHNHVSLCLNVICTLSVVSPLSGASNRLLVPSLLQARLGMAHLLFMS